MPDSTSQNRPQSPHPQEQEAPQNGRYQQVLVAAPAVSSENPQKNSAMGITGLVLGLIAIALAWIPFINVISIFLGFLGFIFALVGVVATVRKRRMGKGIAIGGLVVSLVSLWLASATGGLFWAVLAGAAASSSNSHAAVSTSAPAAQQAQEDNKGAAQAAAGDLKLGQSVTLKNGLVITVQETKSLTGYSKQSVEAVKVSYQNQGKEKINLLSGTWKAQDKDGAETNGTAYLGDHSSDYPMLSSVDSIAAGGKASGYLFYSHKVSQLNYYGDVFSDKPSASWKLS